MKVVLQNLTKQFPGRGKGNPPVIAVNDFNFEIIYTKGHKEDCITIYFKKEKINSIINILQ